jgi:hypothetical protein
MNQHITVSSTYGDGPDVLVSGESSVIILMESINPNGFTHGTVSKWQLDLSVDEALALSHDLFMAATHTQSIQNMERMHDCYMENMS